MATQYRLLKIDHENKIFYQCDPAPGWPQPTFRLDAAEDPALQFIVTALPSDMSALLDEEYRLIVGYVLSAYHSYRYEYVQRASALGQQMVREWEEYD
jgi:hypothetical protein